MRAFQQVSLLFKVPAYLQCRPKRLAWRALPFEGIPSKFVSIENSLAEALSVEINLRKRKWLLSCSYKPNRENHLKTLSENLALYSSSNEKLIIVGDFNVCVEEFCILRFCDIFGLKSLIKDTTCSKNPETQVVLTSFQQIIHVDFKFLV